METSEAQKKNKYEELLELLNRHRARYRVLDHPPEGRTEKVSPLRGHPTQQAAKCIILMVKQGKKVTKYVLGVVPGDARIDLARVKKLLNASYVSFARADIAEDLAGSVSGTILPFALHPDLELIVDPLLLENQEIYFNAARLDKSLALNVEDYRAVAKPRLARIAQ